jgi:hypothetical protein
LESYNKFEEKMSVKIDLNKIYIPSEKIIARHIEDDLIIVPVEAGTGTVDFDESLYSLEGTGREIWENLKTKTNVEIICSQLADEYDAPLDTIIKDVTELLTELLIKGLIVELR